MGNTKSSKSVKKVEAQMEANQKMMQANQEKLDAKIDHIQRMMMETKRTMEVKKQMIEQKIDTATDKLEKRLGNTCSSFMSEIEKAVKNREHEML
jgi:hypothetical protein